MEVGVLLLVVLATASADEVDPPGQPEPTTSFAGTAPTPLLVVPRGQACAHAIQLAREIAHFPQTCLRADRLSALRQWDLDEEEAIKNEMRGGLEVIASGETLSGAARFASGAGRHGNFGASRPGEED